MIRTDEGYLLFIEPQRPPSERPRLDLVAKAAVALLRSAVPGEACRGFHVCKCGVCSGNRDLFIEGENGPVLVNNLMVHYMMWHRNEVPEDEFRKISMCIAVRPDWTDFVGPAADPHLAGFVPTENESKTPKGRTYSPKEAP